MKYIAGELTTLGESGTLYLVATPIGNLEDITFRALRILKEVDLIAAEDTRQTIKLLNHFEIKKSMVSYFEHNKLEKGNYLLQLLLEGKSIALVSDAGTPAISDPGEDLVRLAIENGITVTMTPGPSAAIMALAISGLPSKRFVFEGFLPANKKLRQEKILSLKDEIRTIIFYEAPHKLKNTLGDLYKLLGNREIALARELTKKFEQVIRCTLEEACKMYVVDSPKGEFVIVLEGIKEEVIFEREKREWEEITLEDHVKMYLKQGLDKKIAMKKTAEDRGISKREVYNSLLIK
jgi:16S rRNA (cytidine1402-2'-O)-methyltransferase